MEPFIIFNYANGIKPDSEPPTGDVAAASAALSCSIVLTILLSFSLNSFSSSSSYP